MGAVVSIFSQVGERSIVAEGSVVKLNQAIPDRVVAAGNPAQIVRAVSDQDEEMWAFGKQVYIDLAAKYLRQGMTPVS
jgi:carbonic anhydrase/acetyltransferase-like protein (isoleucine patch superfamily)